MFESMDDQFIPKQQIAEFIICEKLISSKDDYRTSSHFLITFHSSLKNISLKNIIGCVKQMRYFPFSKMLTLLYPLLLKCWRHL